MILRKRADAAWQGFASMTRCRKMLRYVQQLQEGTFGK